MDVKTMSIDKIGLSVRSQNALHRAEVHTVGDMLCHTENSLNEIRNLGKKSIEEIVLKIEEYKRIDANGDLFDPEKNTNERVLPENYEALINEETGQEFVIIWLKEKKTKIDALEFLSARSYNILMLNDFNYLHQIAFKNKEELMQIPRMDHSSADEIIRLCNYYLNENSAAIMADYSEAVTEDKAASRITIFDMLHMPEYHDVILNYVKMNDKEVRHLGLSNRPQNRLLNLQLEKMSDIVFKTRSEFLRIPSMGNNSVEEIMSRINDYLTENQTRLMAVCNGDDSALLDDASIRDLILKQYREIGFKGLSLNEMKERLQLPDAIETDRLKKIIGGLLAENELEYVDFRCYKVYGKFTDHLSLCTSISDRSKAIIHKRLQGQTLEEIGNEYNLTRERVRQIAKNDSQKVCDWYTATTKMNLFDEDYYRYFYENYTFEKKDAIEWLGLTVEIINYLEMMNVKRGNKDLQTALEDHRGLDAGLRLKIKNYLNRNKIFVDGMWVEKRRADLEEVVVRKLCRQDTIFDDFPRIYNEFLEKEDIAFDEDIYFTDAVYHTRQNRLQDARFLLWKQGAQFRYYDIDGQDFTELLDTLNLESYENIELSTLKLVENYPEILKKYDIHDQYELHNLLRKIVEPGKYNEFNLGKMPTITFGKFNRDAALLDILIDNAPVSVADLCSIIHDEYGYDPAVIQSTYLKPLTKYYHKGMYRIDQKDMPSERRDALLAELTDDFYYIDEIRKIYMRLFPECDQEEVNPYNLIEMGFLLRSGCAIQNYTSMDAYFEDILTLEDITDISAYRKRFGYVQSFSTKWMELKRNREIIEFEPNQIINIRKLEQSGITRNMIQDYCDAVYEFVEDGTYFSSQSIRQDGFESELYDLGFSDWFYANLLTSDDRFSNKQMFGNIILYKGSENIMTKSFVMDRIKEYGSIDTYDLITELTERYGCKSMERSDLNYKVRSTEIYYDDILDRFYANQDVYYRELDEAEDI